MGEWPRIDRSRQTLLRPWAPKCSRTPAIGTRGKPRRGQKPLAPGRASAEPSRPPGVLPHPCEAHATRRGRHRRVKANEGKSWRGQSPKINLVAAPALQESPKSALLLANLTEPMRWFTVSGIGQSSTYVLEGEFRILLDNLLVGHPGSEPTQDIVNRDAHTPNARSAAALTRLDGNDLAVVHGSRVRRQSLSGKPSQWLRAHGFGNRRTTSAIQFFCRPYNRRASTRRTAQS